MKSPQSRINGRRMAIDKAAEAAPDLVLAVMSAISMVALAVTIGAALAAIPQLDAVLDKAEQLRGF